MINQEDSAHVQKITYIRKLLHFLKLLIFYVTQENENV